VIPQVPKHQGSAQLEYDRGATLVSAGLRSTSLQFDDDLNQFRLPGYATMQLLARQQINRHFAVDLAIENLLGRQYLTGLTPNPTIGAPRLVRVGIKVH
jgi:outer membrane receptor protein involved in Fe transport